jgi:hypothetical protein
VQERYAGFDDYRKRFAGQCAGLVKKRYVLKEDADRLVEGREKQRKRFAATP